MSDELAELRARCERLELLHQVGKVIHSTLDPQQALQLIMGEAVRLMNASSGSVVLINPTTGHLQIEAAHGLPDSAASLKLRPGTGITGWVFSTGKPARLGDVRHDPRYIMLRENVRSELAVPLEVNGEIRGVLNVDSERENAFSASDQSLLEELAVQAARVIHNTWLFEQARLKAGLLESLVSVSQTINSTLNEDEALEVITREACVLMRAKMCSILLLNESRDWLELRASHGAGAAYRNKPNLSVAESLLGIVIRRRKPVVVENVQTSARYQNVLIARVDGLVSLLSVPLIYGGESIGALNVYTGHPHNFSNEEIHILSALAGLSALAIEKARLYERVSDVEEQLRQAEKLSALGLLAAEVAHEIRNPLTVMKMLYHSMDLQFPAGDPRVKDSEIIREKMDRLNRIVEQILDFARSTEPQLGPVNANELLDDLALLVRHKLTNHNIEFIRRLQSDLPAIMADATQLEQVFLNLTLNAVEAMPDGGRFTITTRALKLPRHSPAPTHIRIEFRDTGVGMTDEQRARAFSSLLTTTKTKGNGLGLAIVARIVETHRGRVRLKSTVGRGTTITVVLPREEQ